MINLRHFKDSDTDLLISYLNNNAVTQYITSAIAKPYTLVDALWWIDAGSKTQYIKAIEHNGSLVGCISATIGHFEYNLSAELGYWIGQEHWGQGIATAAVNEFCHFLFNETELVRLFVSVVKENKASIRVLENNDFVHEGLLKNASYKNGRFFDEYIFAKIKTI
jgi:RimJ/RimL family protein N-acetyltransferase